MGVSQYRSLHKSLLFNSVCRDVLHGIVLYIDIQRCLPLICGLALLDCFFSF